MSPSARAVWIALLSAATQLPVRPALAQAPSAEASVEARRDQAKQRFEAGSTHYAAGRYRQAVVEFVEADRLAPSPALSFNIARAYERLRDTSGALRWYRDYLRRSPNAKNAAEVRARVSELATELAKSGRQQLTVLSLPPGAKVVIDGREVGVTPFTGDLNLGQHRVLLDLSGYREAKSEVALTPDNAEDLSFNLTALPVASTRPTAVTAAERQASFGAWPYVVGGAGLASLGGALAFELKRRHEQDEAKVAVTQLDFKDHADRMEQAQTTARVLAGVGGALVVGGAVLVLLDRRQRETTRLGLGCTGSGCAAVARGRF